MKMLLHDKEFYKRLFAIALPIALQNFISSSLNLIDTVMIGQLGEEQIAAVGAANKVFFLLSLLLFGISSGSSIFTAQYWGKRDIVNIRRILGICLFSGMIGASIFSIGGIFIPRQILNIFSDDIRVIGIGSDYLHIIAMSYIVTSITFSYVFLLRSTGQVRLPVVISILSIGLNTFFNWILIFGHFGFPAMGAKGAAIATVIARIFECGTLLGIIYIKKYVASATIREMTDISFHFIKRFYKTTIPVILNEFTWALGVTVYSIVYGRMGTNVLAAMNITATVEQISMVLFFGLGSATAVMLGNQIGANEREKAYEYGTKFVIIGPALALLMGLGVIGASPLIISVYNIDSTVYEYVRKSLIVFAVFMTPKVFNLINIVGILRSGGDTTFALMLDMGGVWLIGVPLAILSGWIWELPIYWVYAFILLEEVVKFGLGVHRFLSKKWLKNVVDEEVIFN